MEATNRIHVYCRVKPSAEAWCAHLQLLPDERTLLITRPSKSGRPPSRAAARGGADENESPVVTPTRLATSGGRRLPGDDRTQSFVFDRVLRDAEAGVDRVFQNTVTPLIDSALLRGVHTTILSYGERSTDKAHVLFGGRSANAVSSSSHGTRSGGMTSSSHQSAPTHTTDGIAQLVLRRLFRAGALAAEERTQEISLTFLQLYGDALIDLLDNSATSSEPRPTTAGRGVAGAARRGAARHAPSVSLDGNGEVVLRHTTSRVCATEAEALACVVEGLAALRGSVHAEGSSTVLRVTVRQQPVAEALGVEACCAHLHLVDLASTQRLEPGTTAAQRADVQVANKSVSALEQVINALTTVHNTHHNHDGEPVSGGGGPHVPYRQSKLTTLLKGYIGLQTATALLAHIVPSEAHMESTLSTLNFAKRLLRVPVALAANTFTSPETQVRQLQRELETARIELRLHAQLQQLHDRGDAVNSQNGSASGVRSGHAPDLIRAVSAPVGADEQRAIEARVESFLSGSAATVDVQDVREMRTAFAMLRAAVEAREEAMMALQEELEHRAADAHELSAHAEGASLSADGSEKGKGRGGQSSRAGLNAKKGSNASANTDDADAAKTAGFTPSVLDAPNGVGYGTSSRVGTLHASVTANSLTVVMRKAPATAASTRTTRDANTHGSDAAAAASSSSGRLLAAEPLPSAGQDIHRAAPPPTRAQLALPRPPLPLPSAASAAVRERPVSPATAAHDITPISHTVAEPEGAARRGPRPPTAPANTTHPASASSAMTMNTATPTPGSPSARSRPASAQSVPPTAMMQPRSASANTLLLALTPANAGRPGSASLSSVRQASGSSVRRSPTDALLTGARAGLAQTMDRDEPERKRALFEVFKETPTGVSELLMLSRAQETLSRSQRTCDAVQRLVRLAQTVVADKHTAAAMGSAEARVRVGLNGRESTLVTCPSSSASRPVSQRGVSNERTLRLAAFQRNPSLSPATPSLMGTPSSSPPPSLPLNTSPPGLALDLELDVPAGTRPSGLVEAQLQEQMGPMPVMEAEQHAGKLQAWLDQCWAWRDGHARAVEKRRLALLHQFEIWYARESWQAAAPPAQTTVALPTIMTNAANATSAAPTPTLKERGSKRGSLRAKQAAPTATTTGAATAVVPTRAAATTSSAHA